MHKPCHVVFTTIFVPHVLEELRLNAERHGHLEKVKVAANVTVGPFSRLRPGTELAEADVPIDVIQELLGHQSIITNQRYVHSSQRRLRDCRRPDGGEVLLKASAECAPAGCVAGFVLL